jgi:murein DD-endopeptidase MepM/ murein hydrolase activator NlpD
VFRFPADDPKGLYFSNRPIIHVDHDPRTGSTRMDCVAFDGTTFPWCYDGHDGTDFLLYFGFSTMDQYDVRVVAAADGVVSGAQDGNYDRCHAESGQVTCDGNPIVGNGVEIRHADGIISIYWHMKKGSVKVKKGDKVRCGDLLGYVGSSGNSAMPHVHFGVVTKDGEVLDPFAGSKSQRTSYWTRQVGPFGWPGDRCAGDPYPDDGGVGSDGGAGGDAGEGGAASRGCSLAPTGPARGGPLGPVLPVLAILVARALRRGRGSNKPPER